MRLLLGGSTQNVWGLFKDLCANKNTRFLAGTFAVFFTGWSCSRHVPAGHVGLIENFDGTVKEYMFEEKATYFFNPLRQKSVVLRTFPVRKKLIRILKTKDGKDIEVFLQVRIYPKLAFVPEIYMRFGRDYGRRFLDEEIIRDVTAVVSLHTYTELLKGEGSIEQATQDITERIKDAGAFHKIKIAEASIIFRDPDATED